MEHIYMRLPLEHRRSNALNITPAAINQDIDGNHGRSGMLFDLWNIEDTSHGFRPRSTSDLTSVPETVHPPSPTSSPSSWSSWPDSDDTHAAFDPEATHINLERDQNNPFSISTEGLAKLIKNRDLNQLHTYGGIQGIAKGLLADCDSGLDSSSDVSLQRRDDTCHPCTHAIRRAIFGTNQLPEKKAKSIWRYTIDAIKDPVIIFLLVADVSTMGMRIYERVPLFDMIPSILALALVVSVGILLAWRSERRFTSGFREKDARAVWVVRSGSPTSVSVDDVMVGDTLMLKQGDVAPADGILISGRDIKCDESCNTGESRHMAKIGASEALEVQESPCQARGHDPFIISGSRIVAGGSGKCLVTCVGANSTQGRLMLAVPENTEETPLQQRLRVMTNMMQTAAVIVAILLFVTLLIQAKWQVPIAAESNSIPRCTYVCGWMKVTRIFQLANTVILVAVPEGLPMAVLITNWFASRGMRRDNNLVRKLSSCETMGNATTACCDKTGTLTTNEMTVTAGIIGTAGRCLDAVHSLQVCSKVRDILLKSATINSSVFVGDKDGKPEYIGSSTETALVRLAEQCFGLKSLQEERDDTKIVEVFPFDSTRKCMATVTKVSDNLYRMYVKGAPEILLEESHHTIEDPSQSTHIPMTEERRSLFMDGITEYASASLRTLGLAYRDFSAWPTPDSEPSETSETRDSGRLFQQAFQGLTFLGVLGIQDPIRSGVKDAVKRCQGAGVVVRMVTGDNVNTAKAVATECGILDQAGLVLEGPELRVLSDDEMKTILPQLRVLARSSPEDKQLIVNKLKELGETVAVTGDGTNDGPALRAADVGFAMGISGTDVAKEASSIVLEDDNFASIVKAIAWGRAVNDSIARFLQFQLTANVTAVMLTFVSAVSSASQEPILTTPQLLWVNLIMDAGAALALATDGPYADVLDRPPEKRTAPLPSWTSAKMIAGQASYQLLVGLYMTFYGRESLGYPPEDPHSTTGDSFATLFFNMFIWMQFFNLINSRRVDRKLNVLEGALKNKMFIAMALLISAFQVLFVFFGGEHLKLQRLDASEWALSVGLGFMSIPLGMAIRCIPDEPFRRFGERIATNSRPVLMWLTPYFLTATERVRDGLPLQWVQRRWRGIVSMVWAMEIRDTESTPDERSGLLAWQDVV